MAFLQTDLGRRPGVHAGTDIKLGASWTVTASHELLEMLADPDINLTAFVQSGDTTGKLYAYEVADACEADNYGYKIGETLVSDFVFPAWFESFPTAGAQLDQQGQIQRPFEILPGGWVGFLTLQSSRDARKRRQPPGWAGRLRLIPPRRSTTPSMILLF